MRAFGRLHLLFAAKTLINVTSKVGYQGKQDDLMNIFSKELKMSILYIIHPLKSLRAIDPFDCCKKQFKCTKGSVYGWTEQRQFRMALECPFLHVQSQAAGRVPLGRVNVITRSIIAK